MSAQESPADFSKRIAKHFEKKADHNKNEALLCFSFIVVFSLVSPIFFNFGEGAFWGKIVPSVLSLSVAAVTSWTQLRKPQNLWSIYRDAQRRIEDNFYKFSYDLEEYGESSEKEKLLVNNVRLIIMQTHKQWMPIVPSADSISAAPKDISNKT